eukprot:12133965-Alexandrium_andersonii.AAC.1
MAPEGRVAPEGPQRRLVQRFQQVPAGSNSFEPLRAVSCAPSPGGWPPPPWTCLLYTSPSPRD